MARSRLFPELAGKHWTLWASHERVRGGAWTVLLSGLSQKNAVDEMTTRQDRVRRTKQPCKFRALIEGESPE